MSSEPDILNIPAFQRKRSIAAKARNTHKAALRPLKSRLRPEPIEEIVILPDSRRERAILEMNPVKPTGARTSKFKEMKTCGICEGYFEKINVAIIKLTAPLKVGEIILLEKEGGLFQQEIKSMQIDRKEVKVARTGSDIGLKVEITPTIGGKVYRVL